jgi:hypothetical protein
MGWRSGRTDMAMTTQEHSIQEAIGRGRSGRGRSGPEEWVRVRAQVLQELSRGLTRARIGGTLGVSSQRVTQLAEEACDAVLRGEAEVHAADEACAPTWRRWCESRGDELACRRLRARAAVQHLLTPSR